MQRAIISEPKGPTQKTIMSASNMIKLSQTKVVNTKVQANNSFQMSLKSIDAFI